MTTPNPNCQACHGTGTVTDWVDYGSTTVEMETDCECLEEAPTEAALFAPLKDHPSPYPPELFEAQRAAFVAKIRRENGEAQNNEPKDEPANAG